MLITRIENTYCGKSVLDKYNIRWVLYKYAHSRPTLIICIAKIIIWFLKCLFILKSKPHGLGKL